jgi:membrane-associated phospholipid phosphatase
VHTGEMRLGERLLTAVLGVAVFYGAYGVVGAAQVGADLQTLQSPLDRVPLMPWTVAIYLFLFAQVVAPLAVLTDRGVLRRGLACYALLVLSGAPFWLFFPVTVPREPVPVHDLWTYGLAVTRFVDPPTNCFPSMHVAESVAAAALIYRHHKALGLAWGVGALAITGSTVALGQHWVADAAAGAVLGVGVVWLVFKVWPVRDEAWRPLPLRHNLWPLLFYALLFMGCAAPWWFGWVGPEDLGAWGAPPPPAG